MAQSLTTFCVRLLREGLRAYDAVQLAAAVELNAQWNAAGTGTLRRKGELNPMGMRFPGGS